MIYLYIGLGIIAFLILGQLIAMVVVCNLCYNKFFRRHKSSRELTDAHYDEFKQDIYAARAEIEAMPFSELTCTAFDGVELYAKYYDFGRDKTVILVHGAWALPLNNFSVMAKRFIEWGFNLLIPDMRAHGKSGGEYLTFGQRESADLLEWIKLVKSRSAAKIVLYGVSMGSTTIGFASDMITDGDVCAAVYDCGFTSMSGLLDKIAKSSHAPRPMFAMLRRKCKRQLNIDLSASITDHLKNSKIPAVFIHGTEDISVSPEETKRSYSACAAPKELILVEGCGHTTAAIRGDAPQRIYNFIKNYI